MGNAESYEEDELDKFDGIETLGYRVLGVQPNSPASKAGLVSFFDFLVGANQKMLLGSAEGLEEGDEYDDVDFVSLLQEFENKRLELLVWNIKSQQKRFVTIVPRNDWGGAGLLGVTIRVDNYGGADERLIRVLEIEKNSPAAIAGLVPLQDYLLGTTTQSLDDTTALADVLQQHSDRVVELYVYNTTSDVVRIVALMPTLSWGGMGLLGAEVGTGYLHRLPMSCRGTTGSSVERKVIARRPGDGGPMENSGELCMAPQLEMEPEPGQAHAMPMPELKASIPPEKTVPVAEQTEVAPPPAHQENPEHTEAVRKPPGPEPPTATPELTAIAKEPVVEKPEPVPEPPPAPPAPQVTLPPPAGPPPAAPPVPPPPPPPHPEDTAQPAKPTVATAYSAPTAASVFSEPAPPAQKLTPVSQYASAFLPPPPMSHLSKNKDEVDLR